ncbi:tetratricopeptide repeat protein [Methylomonas sp. 2BW1-5-20]|uniref:tetratricopeptide repeat protein n=1 Tax=Methylomonas sp. 2BW1-5-20 TaxID=3376686 RepID=UPI00404D9FA5
MSLINQMLRDLEQRNPQTAKPAPKLELRSTASGGRRRGWLWLLGIAAALPIVYIWRQTQTDAPAAQAIQASAPIQPAPLSIPAPITAPPIAKPTAKASTPMENASPPPATAIEPLGVVNKPIAPELAIAAAPTPIPQTIAPVSAKPVKATSPAQQAEALYKRARAGTAMSSIRENLLDALKLEPTHLPARTLLLQTLLKYRASPAEIAAFVQESLALFPNNLFFVKTQAHLYVQQKNFAAAVSILERIDSNMVDDPAYLALLAAGYQQQQQFTQAAPLYRRLTELQADKAEYWLGLAMNQDKLNQIQAAAESYRQALDKNTLNAEVVSYIKQRLDALN